MTAARQNDAQAIREVFAYLCVPDAEAAIAFYKAAFGARELFRLTEPAGRIGHVELQLGPSTLMLCEEYPEFGIRAPQADGSTGTTIHLHVENADAMARQAVAAGATLLGEPKDQFYGERSCRIRDPFGHSWLLGHEIERVSPEEMQRRYTKLLST